jgi:transcriptional regulator with XRE-family HTH domain
MDIHQKLAYIRNTRKRSREDIATYLDCSVSHIGHIEGDRRGVKIELLKKMAKFYEIPIDFFLDDDIETLEDYWAKNNVKIYTEKYKGYFEVVKEAINKDITPNEMLKCLIEIEKNRNPSD